MVGKSPLSPLKLMFRSSDSEGSRIHYRTPDAIESPSTELNRHESFCWERAFERLGLVRTIHPEQLTVENLRRQIGSVMEAPRARVGPGGSMMFDGAQRAAAYLLELQSAVRRTNDGRLERMVSK